MFLQNILILYIFVWEFDWKIEPFLLPKDWNAASQAHMRKYIIQADEKFLRFNKIGSIAILIDPSAVKSRSWHIFASSANADIIKWKIIVFAIYFFYKSLNNRDSPALW